MSSLFAAYISINTMANDVKIITRKRKSDRAYYENPKWLHRLPGLSSEAKDLYQYLEDLGKQFDATFPSHERMAFEIGKHCVSENTIKSYLKELYALQWVVRILDPKTNWASYEVAPIEDVYESVKDSFLTWDQYKEKIKINREVKKILKEEGCQKTDTPPISNFIPPYQKTDTHKTNLINKPKKEIILEDEFFDVFPVLENVHLYLEIIGWLKVEIKRRDIVTPEGKPTYLTWLSQNKVKLGMTGYHMLAEKMRHGGWFEKYKNWLGFGDVIFEAAKSKYPAKKEIFKPYYPEYASHATYLKAIDEARLAGKIVEPDPLPLNAWSFWGEEKDKDTTSLTSKLTSKFDMASEITDPPVKTMQQIQKELAAAGY